MNKPQGHKTQTNKRHPTSLRSIFAVIKLKLNQRYLFAFTKLHHHSLKNSPQVLALKCQQLQKRLTKIFSLKTRIHWAMFINNLVHLDIDRKEKQIALFKLKDKAYQAKVKSLRVLSRQWKQKKSQNEYKNKYFTPKSDQTPKMVKEKVAEEFYLVLRNILRNKYLLSFNSLKSSLFIKIRTSKGMYLGNYLMSKKRYWVMYGFEKLKVNVLRERETKNKEEIESLEVRLVPVQDAQVVSLKEKQQKLQSALDVVLKEKEQVTEQVDKQTKEMQSKIKEKQQQVGELEQQKQSISGEAQFLRQSTSEWQFSREQIFYHIYRNFMMNLRLWSSMQSIDQGNIFLNKALVMEWLQCPVVDLDLDKVHLKEEELGEVVKGLTQLIREYRRVKANQLNIDWNQSFQQFFSNYSGNQCNNYQELLGKIKLTSKMLTEIMKENRQVINNMLETIDTCYNKLTQNQSFQVLEC